MSDAFQVKAISESAIQAAGGETSVSLPLIDLEELNLRPSLAVAERALVLNILVNMSFGALPSVALEWITSHNLLHAVTDEELTLLHSSAVLNENDKNRLRWNIEALWAAAWAGNLVKSLTPTQPIADTLASLFPSLRTKEPPDKFLGKFHLRPLDELYQALDLFYRAHWYTRNCELTGKSAAPFNLGIVQYRRQLIEWVTHADVEWADVDLST